MDFSWLAEPHTWIGFATLLVLEVVLGIDNLVFVAILANKVKPSQRDRARITGLGLAVVIRIFMLGFMAHIMTLTRPLFELGGLEISGKDMIMFAGGIFLLYNLDFGCGFLYRFCYYGSGDGGSYCGSDGCSGCGDDGDDFRQ